MSEQLIAGVLGFASGGERSDLRSGTVSGPVSEPFERGDGFTKIDTHIAPERS